jgi:hypothetical protein
LDDEHNASEPSLDERAENELPVFEIFPTESGEAREHGFFAIPTEANDQVDASGPEAVGFSKLHVLTVEEHGKQVGVNGTGVFELDFLDKIRGDGVEFVFGGAEAHVFESLFCGIDRASGREQTDEQSLCLIGVSSFVGRRQRAGSKRAGSSTRYIDIDRDAAHHQGTLVASVALVGVDAREVVSTFGLAEGGQHQAQKLSEIELG